ncbi:MAG: MBL fold metallo-hydrolase [Pseudomonadota bacterium]
MKHIALVAAFGASLLVACAGENTEPLEPAKASSTPGNATAILNAGVTADLGEQGQSVKILFDPLYDDHYGSFQQLSEPLIDAIVTGAPPYDNVAAVFVSHAHGDHFSVSQLTRMLAEQPDLRLVAPEQAVEQLRASEKWDTAFDDRITGLSLENGAQSESFEIAGATIEAFRSPHNGWPDRHADVHNITYRVSAPGEAGLAQRVMFLGDADPGVEYFEPHAEFLAAKRTSLAIVPFWFLQADDAETLFDATLNTQSVVGMHVPVREPGWLSGSGWDYFTGVGQTAPIPDLAAE